MSIHAPPLAASSRVLGPSDYVINTLLYGLQGPIAGTAAELNAIADRIERLTLVEQAR